MALRTKVINFIGLRRLNDANQVCAVRQIAIVQHQIAVIDVRVLIDMINALSIKRRRTALDAMHFISLLEQKFGQIRAVLAGHAGNESDFFQAISSIATSFFNSSTAAFSWSYSSILRLR